MPEALKFSWENQYTLSSSTLYHRLYIQTDTRPLPFYFRGDKNIRGAILEATRALKCVKSAIFSTFVCSVVAHC